MSNVTGTQHFTTQPWTIPGLVQSVEILNFIAYFICFLIGTAGNSFALHFFLSKKKDLATITYIFISSTDLLVGILMLPISLPFIGYHRYMYLLEMQPWFCNLWGVLWYCCTLITVFLVAVVCITRCICITFPLARLFLNKKLVIGIVIGYLVVVMCQATIPFWVGNSYAYYPHIGTCTWTTNQVLSDYPAAHMAYSHIINFELYILILPILVSSIMTICVLNRPRSQMSQSNRSVTVTIICFTFLYVIFNIPVCLVQLLIYLKTVAGLTHINNNWMNPYGFSVASVLTVGANSALNPCVYVWRTRAFRQHLIDIINCRRRNGNFRRTMENSMAYMMRYTQGTRRKTQARSPTILSLTSPLPTAKSVMVFNREITEQEDLNENYHSTLRNRSPNGKSVQCQSPESRSHDTVSPERQSPDSRSTERQSTQGQSPDSQSTERQSLQRIQAPRLRLAKTQTTEMQSPESRLLGENLPRKRPSRKMSPSALLRRNSSFTDAVVMVNPSFTEEDGGLNLGTEDELLRGSQEFYYPFRTTLV